jgi:chloramphenicol-sensitive protein RarD
MAEARPTAESRSDAATGILYALAAYGFWGVVPIYWKLLGHVPPLEILAHRVLWTLLGTALLLAASGRAGELRATLRSGPRLLTLTLSALLIGGNWGVFLWAMLNDRLLEASLGYYLNPLVNVVLGRLFLGERLSRGAGAAVALAGCGVAVLAVGLGGLPWVSLYLAVTFALYGLVRKVAPVRPLVGLTVETAILVPLAVGYLVFLSAAGRSHFVAPDLTALLLIGGGFVTAFPLLCFASAARRLWLTTLGLVQYLAPSLTFLLAVAVYREPFSAVQGGAFALIWVALAVYTVDALRGPGVRRQPGGAAAR